MNNTPPPFTIRLERRILEHPRALHLRRIRSAIWLYLALLARLPAGQIELEFGPVALASELGLPDGTIRSWLGHLRKHRYISVRRSGTSLQVTLRDVRADGPVEPLAAAPNGTFSQRPPRHFTAEKLERALGETGHRDGIDAALAAHEEPVLQRALAGALAVPANEIRRSRTALFLYLLKRQPHATPTNDSRS